MSSANGFVTPEERLLILMSFSQLSEREVEEAKTHGEAIRDWDELWRLAEGNATAPLVFHNLEAVGLAGALPEAVRARFQAKSDEIQQANEARLKVARELFRRFAEQDIPVVILKGVLFAETIYHDPYYKKMNDVDILVRKQDLDGVFDIYDEMSFFSAAELIGGNPRKQEKFSHHAPPFFSRDLKCMIGTHWGLITPLAPYTIDYDAIWSRVVDFDFYGSTAKAMAPEDNLHHLCVHLPYYKTGVRELADIYNLVRHCGPKLDWELLLHEVAKAGSEGLMYHALSLSNRLCPDPAVEEVIRRVEPKTPAYTREDTLRKTERLSQLLRSRSVHMSRIEKAFTDLNISNKASEKREAFLRMWAGILATPREDVVKMNSLRNPGLSALLKGRLVTPWRIYQVFKRDLGRKIFFLLMFKTLHDVVSQSVKEPFQGDVSVDDYEAVAQRLGVTVADLQALKDALE